jgi:hypothetical protein
MDARSTATNRSSLGLQVRLSKLSFGSETADFVGRRFFADQSVRLTITAELTATIDSSTSRFRQQLPSVELLVLMPR